MKNIKKRVLIGALGVSLAGGMYALGRFTTPKEEPIDSNQTSISTNDELVDKYLTDLSQKREELEKEIENLKLEKEKLQEESKDNTEELSAEEKKAQQIEELRKEREEHKEIKDFRVSDLIVIEARLGEESSDNLYILCPTEDENIYVEYHGAFNACNSKHEEYKNQFPDSRSYDEYRKTEEYNKVYRHYSNNVHFHEYRSLMSYMDDHDIEYIQNSNGVLNTLELDEYLDRIRTNQKKADLRP